MKLNFAAQGAKMAAHNLFLCVFVGGKQVNSLHVSEVDVMAEEENEEKFAHVFLLLVAIQGFVTWNQGGI